MILGSKRLGIDIGGSHASLSVVDTTKQGKQLLSVRRIDIDSSGKADEILNAIAGCIREIITEEPAVEMAGLAFPGPFDYKKGVSAITGVGGKFKHTFGLHVQQALKNSTGLHELPFTFSNDAHCFAIGAYQRHQLQGKRIIFLTLGTGFGSAFMLNGELLSTNAGIPATGTFYDQAFLSGTAEDYISTRWFLQEYERRTGATICSVKELAASNTDIARSIFSEFGSNLGTFLLPWLRKFECDELVIGGNITGASGLFGPSLIKEISVLQPSLNITWCDDTEECILTGAVLTTENNVHHQTPGELVSVNRKTLQPLLPLSMNDVENSGYNIYPSYQSAHPVYNGFESLAERICNERTVIIDGYGGVLWELFRVQLQKALHAKNKKVFWYDVDACLHTPDNINSMLAEHLNGDDPVFGKKYSGDLADFFDSDKLELLQPDAAADIAIVYGTGAALSKWKGLLVYVDVPKNEIQYRMRAGAVRNLGAAAPAAAAQMYKRFYFVDWPVLNKHKERLLPLIDCIADEQRITTITWMHGNDFRSTLNSMFAHALRARPWFEAGIWGGHWMKNKIAGLNKEEVNYAWSFELITPENGIVLEGDSYLLEVSFDFLLFCNNTNLLGKAAKRFGNEFPIRFDFLDTYDGGNLSVQCHPRTAYIRERFGENFTQDETYYILDCEAGAKVYLGFQNDIDPDEFKTALIAAQENAVEMQVEQFVQQHDVHKHDLFLIPNGTVHASGKNNMVLEISNTPYIFTFKMYDWQRLDLNGQPRPINIEHAFNNLYFDRKGDYVPKHLIAHPYVESEWDTGRKLKLPTHEEHFYTIDRYEFTGAVDIATNGQCHCCMIVEGTAADVVTGSKTTAFSYAETFIIPAAVHSYRVHAKGEEKVFLIVACVKDDHC